MICDHPQCTGKHNSRCSWSSLCPRTKAKTRECLRKYYADNSEAIKKRRKKYHAAHADVISARKKAYYRINKDKILARCKRYAAAHREELSVYFKKYHLEHREKHNAQMSAYQRTAAGMIAAIRGQAKQRTL